MYDSILTSGTQELLSTRLAQTVRRLRSLSVSTKEDALVEIYSAINAVLALGNNMTPLVPITARGPAKIGDVEANFTILNNDAQALIRQILDTENDASGLYNTFASVQNTLRQSIRESIYRSTTRVYTESLINDTQLQSGYSTALDFNAGAAANTQSSEVFLTPDSVAAGVLSVGSLDASSTFSNLLDANSYTSAVWNGKVLDLVISFNTVQIVNTLRIELLGYQGLVVEQLTSTPDGVLIENLLSELPDDNLTMDGNSSKFSGDWIALFDPRHVKQIRLVLRDVAGTSQIQLRNLYLSQRKYANRGVLNSSVISAPLGKVRFDAEQHTVNRLTTISHQLSTDGVSYVSLAPGQVLTLAGTYWYQATLQRIDSNFAQTTAPLSQPNYYLNYTVSNFVTTDLGNGIVARKFQLSNVVGAVDLEETPLTGTLSVTSGATIISPSNYSLSGSILTFHQALTNITVQYQTSSYGSAGLLARQPYYSPYLYGYSFTAL